MTMTNVGPNLVQIPKKITHDHFNVFNEKRENYLKMISPSKITNHIPITI